MQQQLESIKIGQRTVRLSNLAKPLYPSTGFTKADVIDYYRQMAPVILKYLRGRALTLKRYPNGVEHEFFYEKNCPTHKPDWVPTVNMNGGRNGNTRFCVVDHAATLLWVANLASIELHTLLSRAPHLDRPTMMVFDLDPGPPAGILDCLPVAFRLRDILSHVGLESFAKTSGGKGLHIYVPLNVPNVTFEQTKHFAHLVAIVLERDDPKKVTSVMRRDLRAGKVFVDWSQNDQHKTTVCAYSLRAVARPSVSMPVSWDDIDLAHRKADASGLSYEPAKVIKKVNRVGDLFEPVLRLRQKLPR